MNVWPDCARCGRSLSVHYLRGSTAFCERERTLILSKKTGRQSARWRYPVAERAPFTVEQVNNAHRALGHTLSSKQLELETAERVKARSR